VAAEYTIVLRHQVIAFHLTFALEVIGAIPETLQTAYGSLTTGLDPSTRPNPLVRGGTSSLGIGCCRDWLKTWGATVFSTTPAALTVSRTPKIPQIMPSSTTGKLPPRPHSHRVCPGRVLEPASTPPTGYLWSQPVFTGRYVWPWNVVYRGLCRIFYPIGYLPKGVRFDRLWWG